MGPILNFKGVRRVPGPPNNSVLLTESGPDRDQWLTEPLLRYFNTQQEEDRQIVTLLWVLDGSLPRAVLQPELFGGEGVKVMKTGL